MSFSPAQQPPGTAAHVFRTSAVRAATRPALRQGSAHMTYEELSRAAGGVADWLREQGVGRGDVVATLMDRSHRCVIAVLAAWAVGAAYVHIEATDPDPRVTALLETTRARAVITDERNERRVPGDGPPLRVLHGTDQGAEYRIDPGLDAEDVAYLVCTSGSTGTPKAVVVRHRALLNYCRAFRQRVQARSLDSFGLVTTFAADLGKVSVYGALLSGARLDVYPRQTTLDPVALGAELSAHPVDCLTYTPSQMEALAAQGSLAALLPRRVLVVAGEPFPPRLAGAVLRARPDLEVYNGYGPSEATILATMHRVGPEDARRPRVPVGTPLAGVEACVRDENRRPVADGTPGVLYLGGACVASGYLGEAALTETVFVPLEDRPEAGLFYRTDDLVVREPGGLLDYLGRADRQLKIRGNRVEPGEVETALLSLPGVRQAVVTGERPVPDAPLELVAYVVADADPRELTRRLRAALPSALVPSGLHVVPGIPVNLNGKADFATLRAAVRAAAGSGTAAQDASQDPPCTATERLVAGIWAEALGRARVGRHERFLEIGGDSFKALTVFARLRRHHPRLGIAQLYTHATVAALASALDQGEPGRTPPPAAPDAGTVIEL
ncbi:non-ribosomal peptide synthetase [Streptomyces sp. MST-110588]|uniref:non-ribosomal peptide synthetase n=1 Tax=Streptomyces sp. MST-110588 TaxID=2833628 RepID=UPI001F5CAB33|nr:non-ribosomal peptide synthetase [Streptomyces sp. MST-110588]UNO40112.1 non-ribosomal peptide synthetase [Streptomyces sp. MST-110588]